MVKLRLWISAALLWLAFLLHVERLCTPIRFAPFVYAMAALLVVGAAALPLRKRWQAGTAVAVTLILFLALKLILRHPLLGPGLPLTVTEALALGVSLWVGHHISQSLLLYERSVRELAALNWVTRPMSFLEMQDQFYREVRRARLHERPLSLLAVRLQTPLSAAQLDALIVETQSRLAAHYQDVRLAELLSAELTDCDLIAKRDDHFILMLAEADVERAWEVAHRLADASRASFGVGLAAGVATFPDEEVTLTGLVQRAEAELGENSGPALSSSSQADSPADGLPPFVAQSTVG